jgi:hypothetical protein
VIVYLVLLLAVLLVVNTLRMAFRAGDQRLRVERDECAARIANVCLVAELEAQIAVPLTDLVAEAERRVIAQAFPLTGRPQAARVILNSGDSFADGQDVVDAGTVRLYGFPSAVIGLPPSAGPEQVAELRERFRAAAKYRGPSVFGSSPGPDWVEITAIGDRERSWIPGPGQKPVSRNGAHFRLLVDLRAKRAVAWEAAKQVVAAVEAQARQFTPDEADAWDVLMEELRVVDARIAALALLMAE